MSKNKKSGVVAANRAATQKGDKKPDNPLKSLVASINKKFGDGTMMVGEQQPVNINFISTGISSLDAVVGGGIPRGRIIEIFGMEGSGKTTTTLEIISSCQKTYFDSFGRNGVCAFVDVEHALDPAWAANVGVKMGDLLFSQPDSGEEAFEIVEMIVKSGAVDLVVVDSVAAMVPRETLEGEITDNQIGAQARLMSKGLSRLRGEINKSHTSVIFINQIRQKVGVMFGNPETTPGGLALKFYASLRIDLRRGQTIRVGNGDDGKAVGVECKANIIKNKVAPPFRKTVYSIYFGHDVPEVGGKVFGVDKIGCLFDSAVLHGVITQSSSFYYYDGRNLGNGRGKSIATIAGDPVLMVALRGAVVAAATPAPTIAASDTDDDELHDMISDAAGEAAMADDDTGDEHTTEDDLTTSAK